MTVTAVGTPEPYYLDRMGWYYRPSKDQYEFWWMGSKPIITLDAFMADIMPSDIVYEIKTAVANKVDLLD
jgi:hypothetical protein